MAKYGFYRWNKHICTLDEIQAARIQEQKEFIRCKILDERRRDTPVFPEKVAKYKLSNNSPGELGPGGWRRPATLVLIICFLSLSC